MILKHKNLIVLSIILSICYQYIGWVYSTEFGYIWQTQFHGYMISGAMSEPFRFRILLPYLINYIDASPALAYSAIGILSVSAFVFGMHKYLRFFLSETESIAGLFIIAMTYNVTLTIREILPWSVALDALFVWGLICLYKRHYATFTLLLVLAVLNRETGVILGLCALSMGICRKDVKLSVFSVMLIGIGGLLIIVVRNIVGGYSLQSPTSGIFDENIQTWAKAVSNTVVLFGVGWILAMIGFQRLPNFIKSISGYLLFYIPAVLIFGVWQESRLLSPLFPILVPSILIGFRSINKEFARL